MAIIKCSECGKEISDKTNECIHCGNPLGKVIFKSEINAVVIGDENGNIIAKFNADETTSLRVDSNMTFYVWQDLAFRRNNKVEVQVRANETITFLVQYAGIWSNKLAVLKVDER